MSGKRVKVVDRRPMGLRLSCPPGRPSHAAIFYRVVYSDGTETYEYGKSVTDLPGVLRVGEKPGPEVRGDLSVIMRAAHLLLEDIEYACLGLDGLLINPREQRKRKRK